MSSNPLVLEISSDDDDALSAWEDPKGEDYDWLTQVLDAVDKKMDDPDEVVVVREVNPNKRLKSGNSTVRKFVDDGDDDECVILDVDPDKALSEDDDSKQDSDELIIVGQKGQIACRDFPHPRHDCGTFPFSSTSHQQHCEQCHCFVCDTHAPCPYWYSGNSTIDHCHATAKEDVWKDMRRNFRTDRNSILPVSEAPVTCTAVPQVNQGPRPTVPLVNQAPRCAVPQVNQAPRRTMPQVNQFPRRTMPQVNQVPRRTLPQFNQAPRTTLPQFNQASWRTVPQMNHATRHTVPQANPAPLHNMKLASQNLVSRQPTTLVGGNCNVQTQAPRPSILSACSSATRFAVSCNQSVGNRHVLNKNTMQPHSFPVQFQDVNKFSMQKETNNWASPFVSSNSMGKQLHTGLASSLKPPAHSLQYQQNPTSVSKVIDVNPIGWPVIGSGTNVGAYTHQSSLHLGMDTVVANPETSQSSVYRQPVPPSNDQPDINQLQNQIQPASAYGLSDFDFLINTVESNQQTSVDCLQLQTSGSTNLEEPFKEVNEGDNSYYKEIENLLIDSQSLPETSFTGDRTDLSPEQLGFDTGMLYFDIGTSWDPLTRA